MALQKKTLLKGALGAFRAPDGLKALRAIQAPVSMKRRSKGPEAIRESTGPLQKKYPVKGTPGGAFKKRGPLFKRAPSAIAKGII